MVGGAQDLWAAVLSNLRLPQALRAAGADPLALLKLLTEDFGYQCFDWRRAVPWKEATPPRAEMTASAGIELFELLCPKTSEPRAGHMEPRGAGQ